MIAPDPDPRPLANRHFLSYSTLDGSDIAMDLYWDLTCLYPSVPVWIDRRQIRPSVNWKKSIREAIEVTRSFILVMTPESVEEDSASGKELSAAQRLNKIIFPLRFYPELAPPIWLGSLQEISFVEGDEKSWRRADQPWSDLSWERGVELLRQQLLDLQPPTVPADMLESTLERLQHQRMRAEKDLLGRPQGSERKRIQDEIGELNRNINGLLGIFEEPGAADVPEHAEDRHPRRPTGPALVRGRSIYVNVPLAPVPRYFQGRDRETARLVEFLKDDSQRLLLVTGRSGIGKTALICHSLKSLTGDSPDRTRHGLRLDGVVYVTVDRASQLSAHSLANDLARALPAQSAERFRRKVEAAGRDTTPARKRFDALLEEMTSGCRVLVLDSFEDMVDAGHQIKNHEIFEALASVLTHRKRHGLKVILATRVAPLELQRIEPARLAVLELLEGLSSPYAEQVLRAMDPGDALGLESAPEELLGDAQKRTGGNPRALEALYGILRADRHLTLRDLLADTEKLLPENVLRVLIGETYDNLDPLTQSVMQALAIYGRPVSSAAVDFLLRPYAPGLGTSEPILHRLVNLRLAREIGRQFSLRSVDQPYVFHRIPEGKATDRATSDEPRFTRFALQLLAADYWKTARKEPGQITSVNDLTPQLAEIDLRYAAGDFETAARVLLSIDKYLSSETLVELHERLVGRLNEASLTEAIHESLSNAQQAQAAIFIFAGNDFSNVGKSRKALTSYQTALRIAEQIGDSRLRAKCLINIGSIYLDIGEPEKALKQHEAALEVATSNGFLEEGAFSACSASFALLDLHRYAESRARAEEGLERAKEASSRRIVSYGEYVLALGWFIERDWKAAAVAIRRAKEQVVPENAPDLFVLSGLIELRLGEDAEARHAFAEASRRADVSLERNASSYSALDAKGLAQCGLVLCESTRYFSAAVEAYREAREINSDRGIVQRVLRLFDALAEQDTDGLLSELRDLLASPRNERL